MSVPSASVDAAGYHVPAFADIVAGLQAAYRGIYGQDIAFDSSDQDTQWLGVIASAIGDANALGLAVYNAFSPTTAVGDGLSSVVKVNGIRRLVASYSNVIVTVIAQPGTYAAIKATDGTYLWDLPASFTVGASGTLDVLATCETIGAIAAGPGALSIATPTKGLQSVTNKLAAVSGAPVETDAQLRIRQARSVAKPSNSTLDGLVANLLEIPGVARLVAYENDGDAPDTNGIPGGAISIVIDGGDPALIAQTILTGKGGAGTYGNATSPTPVLDAYGIQRSVAFFRPIEPKIAYTVLIKKLPGYSGVVATAIQQAVSDWTNAIGIGGGTVGKILLGRVYTPALLIGTPYADLFDITGILMSRDNQMPSAADVSLAFNEAPYCQPSYVRVIAS